MELTSVESSHVAAIGYLESDQVLLVRYKDGSLYALPGWNSVAYDQLLHASSKGKALAACAGPRIKIPRFAADAEEQRAHQQDAERVPRQVDTMLQVIDVDASPCCRKAFRKWPTGDEADCPDCGTHFRAETKGATRYWRIVPLFAVHRHRS